jgi:hypothetical protein
MARAIEALDSLGQHRRAGHERLHDPAGRGPAEFFAELKATMLDLAEQRRRMDAPGDLRGLASFLTKNTLTRGGSSSRRSSTPSSMP